MTAMSLPPGWYVVAAANELKNGKPLGIERFGKSIVLWRTDDGEPVAMLDHCPHRSARLSIGKCSANSIQCRFHGFEFTKDGACQLVPETGKAAANLKVETFSVVEKHGFLWIWHGALPPQADVPWFAELENSSWSYNCQTADWPTHVTRCIENQLDYAHLPFVHYNSIGQNMDVTKPVHFDTADDLIRFYPDGTAPGRGCIEFRFPNIWMLSIVPGKFAQMLAFVPVSEHATRLYLRSYQSFVTIYGINKLVDKILQWQSRYILNQDREVVLSQHPQNVMEAEHEVLYQSDSAIKHFRMRWSKTAE